jgi:hypothetical protein
VFSKRWWYLGADFLVKKRKANIYRQKKKSNDTNIRGCPLV